MNSQFLLAAAHSGAGKTTVTLGLLRALKRRGLSVQPFKCGPDYIDPMHHRTAAGRDSINLDRFMMSDEHIRSLYSRYGAGTGGTGDTGAPGDGVENADCCITEGVMGLFDGARKSDGSSADIAKLLDLPVILVLNAKAMAYSAAALLYGLKNFDPAVRVIGVIFNFVDTASHYKLLCAACADVGIRPLGHLPFNDLLRIPSRHLGLDTAEAEEAIGAAAAHIEKHIDLDALLELTRVEHGAVSVPARVAHGSRPRKVLIARDEAFQFFYPENIRRLEEWGEISYFSPLRDAGLPFTPDLLYLPGGYPELYGEQLSGNKEMLRQISIYATAGNGRLIAECGGMMYLGRSIVDPNGKAWPMVDVLDITTSIQNKKMTLGYRTVRLDGLTLKGHEFHFSQAVAGAAQAGAGYVQGKTGYAQAAVEVLNANGDPVETPVFYTPRLLAAYTHFYWGEAGIPI